MNVSRFAENVQRLHVSLLQGRMATGILRPAWDPIHTCPWQAKDTLRSSRSIPERFEMPRFHGKGQADYVLSEPIADWKLEAFSYHTSMPALPFGLTFDS